MCVVLATLPLILCVLSTDDYCAGDGAHLTCRDYHQYLSRVLYNRYLATSRLLLHLDNPLVFTRRSKFDPLWNEVVVGGVLNGAP